MPPPQPPAEGQKSIMSFFKKVGANVHSSGLSVS